MDSIKIDGLDGLKILFDTQDALVEYVIRNTLFFEKKAVFNQAREVRCAVRKGEPIPVRYNSNKPFFKQHEIKTTTPTFRNKSEAVRFTKDSKNYLFHRDTKIRVCCDPDGNYIPKQTIQKYTGHKVSCGDSSTVINYTIAHIWGKTDNPLFFSLLWNYALIPCHYAFLTDKKEGNDPLISEIKDMLKAISIELYDPNRIMDWNQDVLSRNDMPATDILKVARKWIAENGIVFLKENIECV